MQKEVGGGAAPPTPRRQRLATGHVARASLCPAIRLRTCAGRCGRRPPRRGGRGRRRRCQGAGRGCPMCPAHLPAPVCARIPAQRLLHHAPGCSNRCGRTNVKQPQFLALSGYTVSHSTTPSSIRTCSTTCTSALQTPAAARYSHRSRPPGATGRRASGLKHSEGPRAQIERVEKKHALHPQCTTAPTSGPRARHPSNAPAAWPAAARCGRARPPGAAAWSRAGRRAGWACPGRPCGP